MYLIDKLNAICATLGGTTTHKYSINALNEWCILAGGVGGHVYDIAAYNELAVIYGASGGHKYNINALNAIDVAFGGAGAWVYDVDALASIGSNVNQSLVATLSATDTGIGVSTLRMEVSEDQTFEITSGTARFYTNAAGTLGESTTWNVTAGALRTIYLKAPSGGSVLNIPSPNKVIKWGNSSINGWESSTNAARISIEVGKLALTELAVTGTSTLIGALPTGVTYLYLDGSSIAWTYTGALPTGLTLLYLNGNSIAWTYSGALPTELTLLYLSGNSINWTYTGALPTELTYLRLNGNSITWTYTGALPTDLTLLYLSGNSITWTYSGALPTGLNSLRLTGDLINWTGLDVGNNGNIANSFNLLNYRIAKMSSADMVTLLTQLTNRTGTLPATITINDYADALAPPQAVTDAVAALKIAKSITTVTLGQ
jgi:hypothetical protein